MKLDIILKSVEEATNGLGIVWRSDHSQEPTEEGEVIYRRIISGQVVAGDIGFYLRFDVPDEETEMEPETWANLVVFKLSESINNLSMYMNNAAVDIKKKSRELASWERKSIDTSNG